MIDQDREILLFAPDLLGESLAAEIPNEDLRLRVRLAADQLKGHPALVVIVAGQVSLRETPAMAMRRTCPFAECGLPLGLCARQPGVYVH